MIYYHEQMNAHIVVKQNTQYVVTDRWTHTFVTTFLHNMSS